MYFGTRTEGPTGSFKYKLMEINKMNFKKLWWFRNSIRKWEINLKRKKNDQYVLFKPKSIKAPYLVG
jgi:hypothetical protein